MTRNRRRYGFDRTALHLNDKAAAYYSITDPLNIWEYTVGGMTLYDMTGADEAVGLTAGQLNDLLSDLYEVTHEHVFEG